MKKLLLLAFYCCLSVTVFAQTASQTLTVKGIAIDSVTKKTLSYVTVALLDAKTQQSVRGLLTKEDGSFELTSVTGKAYQVVLAYIGYTNKIVNITGTNANVDIGKVLLSPSKNQLNEVSVTALRPVVKQEIDRISYDVQADPETKTQNVLDMLRKVPLVTVDANDNIQLKGNSNYKILINGKPSSLVAHNPSDVFKSMPASSIQKIEIITTPPAKYDAEGLAGIINIITAKKVDEGYNGSVNLRENSLYGPGGGASLTVKQGKFGFSTYAGLSDQNHRNGTGNNTLQTFGTAPTFLTQSSSNTNYGKFVYGSGELSYEIDSLNLVTASIEYDGGTFYSTNNQFSQLFDAFNNLTQRYNLSRASTSSFKGADFGLNYQLGFKSNKDRLLTVSYRYSNSPNNDDNNISIFNRLNYGLPDYVQQNNAGTIEQTFQLDYVHPLKKINIEGGLKAILRNSTSDFENSNLDSLTNTFVKDALTSDNFKYNQDVYSFYNTYQLNLDNWGVKAGIRIENTNINADFVSQASNLNQNYSNVIPSISIQRKFKGGSSINFGFTNRIQRPDIYELNPFVNESNPKFITTGNPSLRPVLNHTFELNYSKFSKGSLNFGLTYSFSNNTIQNVTRLLDTVTFTTYQNVGSNKDLGANISVNYPITKKLNLNLNGRISYITLKGFFNGQLYNNQGFEGYTFAYTGYKFNDTWRAGINAGFYTANISLQGKSSSSVFTSMSLTKDVLSKKGSIFLSTSNPFTKYRNYSSFTRDPTFYNSGTSQYPFRTVSIGINYRFGKLDGEIKKNERGINNDDTKGGGNKGSAGNN